MSQGSPTPSCPALILGGGGPRRTWASGSRHQAICSSTSQAAGLVPPRLHTCVLPPLKTQKCSCNAWMGPTIRGHNVDVIMERHQHLENAQPVNRDDCNLEILFAEALEHMSNALCKLGKHTDEVRWPSRLVSRPAAQPFSKSIFCGNNASHTPTWLPECRLAPNSNSFTHNWLVTTFRTSRMWSMWILQDREEGAPEANFGQTNCGPNYSWT